MSRLRGGLAGLVAAAALTACAETADCTTSALADRSTRELEVFDAWLDEHDVDGVVGEVGWPGTGEPAWQDVGRAWYATAADAGIGTFAWAGAEQWPADYPLAIYRGGDPDRPGLDEAGPQAEVIEQHAGDGDLPRGLALADGSFGARLDGSTYSTAAPGEYGTDYRYPSAESWTYVQDRGIRDVRLAFQWERVQPAPDAPLDEEELGRLRTTLRAAESAGVRVWLDLHSYGRYATEHDGARAVLLLGSRELPAGALADVWSRLAEALSGEPAVAGYGIMNEPHDLPGDGPAWEAASVQAVEAVRAVDRKTPVLVGGYSYSRAGRFPELHPEPWVPEDLGPVLYEAHQYFDADGSGTYSRPFDVEEAEAARQGFGC